MCKLAQVGWGVCLQHAKWVQKNFLLWTMQTGVKMLLVLATNPNGFGILKVLWPGASLGCLEGAWAVVRKAKTWPGASVGIWMWVGGQPCVGRTSSKSQCALMWKWRGKEGKNLKCVPAVGTSASALLLPWPQNLWLHVTHTALPDIPYFYKSNKRLLCVFLASSDSSQVQIYPIWYFLAAWGNSLT